MTQNQNLPGPNAEATPNQTETAIEQTKQPESSDNALASAVQDHAGSPVVVQGGAQGQLLGSVAENGPIDKVLRRAARRDHSGEVTNLIDRVNRDLQSIRQHLSRAPSESKERLFAGLLDDPVLGKRNAVLLCVIAQLEELPKQFETSLSDAREEFLSRPFDYCDVFGKVLPDEFKQHAERLAYRDGLNATAKDDFPVFLEHLESLRDVVAHRGLVGLPTGLKKLDDATSGLRGITYLAGPKGGGKTTLMLSAVRSTLKRCSDVAVLILSFDEPRHRQYQRLLCIEAGCSLRDLLTPGEELKRRLDRASQELSPSLARLRIVERRVRYLAPSEYTDDPRRNLGYDLQSLWSDWRFLERWSQAKHCLVCIDLFQKWPYPESVNSGADADHWRLDILDQIRRMSCDPSRPDGFSILVLSEIRKDTARELTIDDLKGDGRIASDADCVLLMYPADDRHNSKSHDIPITIRIVKGRDGVERVDVPVWLDIRTNRFRDEERMPPQPAGGTASGVSGPSGGLDPLAT